MPLLDTACVKSLHQISHTAYEPIQGRNNSSEFLLLRLLLLNMLFCSIPPSVRDTWLAQHGPQRGFIFSILSTTGVAILADQQPKYQTSATYCRASLDHKGHICIQERLFVLWNTLPLEWVKVKKLLLRKRQAVWGQNMFSSSFKAPEEQSELRWLSFQLVNTLYLVGQDMSHPLDMSLGQS